MTRPLADLTRKRRRRTLPAHTFWLCCLFVFLLQVSPLQAQVIKMATIAPEGSPWHDALVQIGQRWKELSNGKIKLRIYAGGVAGDESDMLRKMRVGQLHAAALTTTAFRSIIPDIEILTFPLLMRTDDELKHMIATMGSEFEAKLEEKGYKVIMWSQAGWVRFFSQDAVYTPEDMQRRKLFFWGSDASYLEILKRSGFNPVPLAVTDLLPSLQTGLVDAFGAPPTAALSFQWFGLAKHMTDLRWQPLPTVTVVNMRQWKRIPEDLRQDMITAVGDIFAGLEGQILSLEDKAVAAMKDHGLTVHTIKPDVHALWEALVEEQGVPVLVGPRISPEAYNKAKETLKSYRSENGNADASS